MPRAVMPVAWALLLALATAGTLPARDTPVDRPPNVLLIVADDQGWADFSFLGLVDDVRTPRLDELASQGVSMSQAYATSPICNPSRVGLITGRYQQRWNNYYYGGGRGLPRSAVTLAERLQQAGYATGYFGKVHTGGPDNTPGKPGFPTSHGFDRFFGTTCGGRVHYLYHSREAVERYGEAAGQMKVGPLWDDEVSTDWEGFTTEAFGDRARRFIRTVADQPWFVMVSFNAVHNFAWQLPASELETRDLPVFPDWDASEQPYMDWYAGVHRRRWPEGRAYYLAQLECLDREVGRLLDLVEELNQTADTVVVYTVDNGGCVPDWADNGPLAGSKYHLLEGGTRTRTLISLPGVIPEDRQHDGVFSALDLTPTLCDLIGISVDPDEFDGRSQVEEICGRRDPDAGRILHWDTGWQWSVRAGPWKLMVTEDERRAQRTAEFEQVDVRMGVHLYHLEDDPGETINLAQERPETVATLRELHAEWREEIGQGTR